MPDIKKVAVIGAGVMGASIAAHVANAGVPVVLLDIVAKDNPNRSAIAEGAVEKLLKADPAPFMSRSAAKFVTTGNIEDDLALVADCDWIIEAVIERLDVKQALYAKIEAARKQAAWSPPTPRRSRWRSSSMVCRRASLKISSSPISSTRRATCACWKWSRAEKSRPRLWRASRISPI